MSGEQTARGGSTEPPNPYIGLRPYKESERQWFFGRDADRKIFIDMVLANRLTLLFAASGVGKSSLLQASVLPRLKDSGHANLDAIYCNNWPGDPLASIRKATLDELIARGRVPADAVDEALTKLPLPQFFQVWSNFSRQPLVLVLDQFEEFFHYHRGSKDFSEYKEQLVRLIIDESIPVSIVISMREDFALALNAFKPDLPTLLFNKFYRLEKLTRDDAELAIVQPAQMVGFQYEPELLAVLLGDLAARDRSSRSGTPVPETALQVEPPYLQIVCAQLFELSRSNSDRTIKLATYRAHNGAKGLLASHIDRVTASLSYPERKLASQCFSHLITRRGTKVAHTADSLAHELRVDRNRLESVLRHLENARLLRSQSQDQSTWFELYHDLFSESVDSWNDRFRAHERLRKTIFSVVAILATGVALYAAFVAGMNQRSHHLRLSRKESSKTIELYTGAARLPDPFRQQNYVGETGLVRRQIAPDRGFDRLPIGEPTKLYGEVVRLLPDEDRPRFYREDGELETATELAVEELKKDDESKVKAGLKTLARLASEKSFARLEESLQGNKGLQSTLASLLNQDSGEKDLSGARIAVRYDFPPSEVAVSFLLKTLAGPTGPLRTAAAGRLGEWRIRSAEKPLLDLLCQGGSAERSAAAAALVAIEAKGWPLPCKLAKQQEAGLIPILQMLGKVHANEAMPELLKLLDAGQSAAVRRGILEALGKMAADVRQIELYLDDSAEEVAVAAAEAAAGRGSTTAQTAILRLREKTKNREYKTRLAIALAQLGEPGPLGAQLAETSTRDGLFSISESNFWESMASEYKCRTSFDVLPILAKNAKVLERAMVGADVKFQRRLLMCLGSRFPPQSTALLTALALAPDIGLNRLAAQHLVSSRDPGALLVFQKMLDIKAVEQQRLAAEMLGKLATRSADKILTTLARDPTQDQSLRVAALEALARSASGDSAGTEPVDQELLTALKGVFTDLQRPDVRAAGAHTLAARAPREALVPLLKLLDDTADTVRQAAIGELIIMRDRAARAALDKAMASRSEQHDEVIQDAHDKLGDSAAIKRRTELLHEALGEDGSAPILTSRTELLSSMSALGRIGFLHDRQPLIAAFNSPHADVRAKALDTVTALGDATWRERMVPLLDDGEESIQFSAVQAFIDMARPVDLAPLVLRLKQILSMGYYSESLIESLVKLRSYAVFEEQSGRILGQLDKRDLPEIANALNTKAFIRLIGEENRIWHKRSFSEIDARKLRVQVSPTPLLTLNELFRGLSVGTEQERQTAAFIVRNRTNSEDTELLLELLTDVNSRGVVKEAAQALADRHEPRALRPLVDRIWLRSGSPLSGPLRDSLKKLTNDFGQLAELQQAFGTQRKYAPLLAAACQKDALEDLRNPTHLTIRQRTGTANIISGYNGKCSDQVLVPLAQDSSVHVRVAAATAMGGLQSPRALEVLHGLLQELNPRVQLAAAQALAESGNPASLPTIRLALQDRQHIRELPILVTQQLLLALQKINTPEAVDILLAAVEADEETVGLGAYRILGDLKERASVERLHALLDNHKRQAAKFRACRDRQLHKGCDGVQHPSGDLLFELGFALARICEDKAAILLLEHDLADVREGAALGLALRHDATLVETLDAKRHASANPLFRHAAYRAIDMTLEIIAALGGATELQILEHLKPWDEDGVQSRVSWTIQELKGYLHGQKRAPGTAN